jgi:hypothetical protein
MGFFGRIGGKIAGGLSKGARLGAKALGSVARIGNKVADTGERVVSGIEKVPIIGKMASGATGVARTGIGLVRQVADTAQTGADILTEGEDIIRKGGQALASGDAAALMEQKRRGEDVVGEIRHQIKQGRKARDQLQARRGS